MIYSETILNVLDNSGARTAKCIKVLGPHYPAQVSQFLIVAIKKYNTKKKIRSGQIHLAVVIKTKKEFYRKTGQFIKSGENAIILLKKDGNIPIGNRIPDVLFFELRKNGLLKLISLAKNLI